MVSGLNVNKNARITQNHELIILCSVCAARSSIPTRGQHITAETNRKISSKKYVTNTSKNNYVIKWSLQYNTLCDFQKLLSRQPSYDSQSKECSLALYRMHISSCKYTISSKVAAGLRFCYRKCRTSDDAKVG